MAITKYHRPKPHPGTERTRDEARDTASPRYGGGPWRIADERGAQRYGHARIDDADPSELSRGEAMGDDDFSPSAVDPELAAAEAAGEIESSGERAGMRRGEKPRKAVAREKPNPKPKKTRAKRTRTKHR